MAKSTVLGYPRIGARRELKFVLEKYWRGGAAAIELEGVAAELRAANHETQKTCGIDLLTCNDFSLYDHVLDMSVLLGVIPERFGWSGGPVEYDTYFAMARGQQGGGVDRHACEMTKWFDTNYHYIVPEFAEKQTFQLACDKPFSEMKEATDRGDAVRPVFIGPISYLLLGKDVSGASSLSHLDAVLEAYGEILRKLESASVRWVQFDEPALTMDLDDTVRAAYHKAYHFLRRQTAVKIFLTTPFGALGDNLVSVMTLPVDAVHVDLCRGASQIEAVLEALPTGSILAAGVVDGRNVWRNNLEKSLQTLERAATRIGNDRLWVTTSCSLLHTPYDLDMETRMDPTIRRWLAFSKQKLGEVVALTKGLNEGRSAIAQELVASTQAAESRKASPKIKNEAVRERLAEQPLASAGRTMPFAGRRTLQREALALPLYPTTTIGSFPQTEEVRQKRAAFRAGKLDAHSYDTFVKSEIKRCIEFQESVGLDVLVHGEFERNDMVEFFAEKLKGFLMTQNGWVQSYGSRCVKPPIIYGDVFRTEPMTVPLAVYTQSLTKRPVKGMLTGPVTIMQWSFSRDDLPREVVTHEIALALQDEVLDLENAGIHVIQIDEPAFREAAPLRRSEWRQYFNWAVQAFRLASTGVHDATMIHTHMCYSDFNDIISYIKELDADAISIETARSHMELLDSFASFKYPNEIGPGVYDIHSPRVPPEDEIVTLIQKAEERLEPWQIWINPDCGLKTREWPETRLSLSRMVVAALSLRAKAS